MWRKEVERPLLQVVHHQNERRKKQEGNIPFFRLYGPVISRILVILFYSFVNNTLFLGSICRNGFVKKNVESLVRDFNHYVMPSAHPHLGVSDPHVGLYDVLWKYGDLIAHIVILLDLLFYLFGNGVLYFLLFLIRHLL
jgi:hypothetical protein